MSKSNKRTRGTSPIGSKALAPPGRCESEAAKKSAVPQKNDTKDTRCLVYSGDAATSRTGFKSVRRAVIEALMSGNFSHVYRAEAGKNLLMTGDITPDELIKILKRSQGVGYKCSPYHTIPSIDCHVIISGGWYVKFFFEADTTFISVHMESGNEILSGGGQVPRHL